MPAIPQSQTSNPLRLAVIIGHRLPDPDAALIRQCLNFLNEHTSIECHTTTNVPKPIPSTAVTNLSDTSDALSAIQTLAHALSKTGHPSVSDALTHVLHLCTEDIELGGLSLSPDRPLSDPDREQIRFLLDAWLRASTHMDVQLDAGSQTSPDHPNLAGSGPPMTLSEKIFTHHLLAGSNSTGLKAGDVIRVEVDWILASELSWMGMLKTIEEIGAKEIWRNDRFWLAADHLVDPRNRHEPKVKDLIEKSERAKKVYRLTDYKGENFTILHTEFVRERAQPGMLVIGSDSHSCSAGAVGCLGIGLGAADVAMSLLTGVSWFKVPESIKVWLTGEPGFGIGGKDVILHILGELKRNTVAAERIVEFCGPGARHLSCDDRFAICNMCTEFGAITGLFVPDQTVKGYIDRRKTKLHKTSSHYFRPDEKAIYAGTYEMDLGLVRSYVAIYPSPDNVVPVTDCKAMDFDGVFIGACTTTEEDLILGALVLEIGLQENLPLRNGKRHVVFGSLPITKRLRELGIVEIYNQAGFTQSVPGCSFCVGMGADRAGKGEVWLSSQNRNFKNRMGKGSFGNLSSAAVVAASSFSMSLTDPSSFLTKIDKARYYLLTRKTNPQDRTSQPAILYTEPQIHTQPEREPEPESSNPTPVPPPTSTPETWTITSKVHNLGDFIDTDALAPAEYLVSCRTQEEIGAHCLEHTHPYFRDAVRSGQGIVVAGEGFGCGSSRENAVGALLGTGTQALIAKSYSFIFARNLSILGLLGIVIRDESFYAAVAENGTEVTINVEQRVVSVAGREEKWGFVLDELELGMMRGGGVLGDVFGVYERHSTGTQAEGQGLVRGGKKEVDMRLGKELQW
ncbi:aconitase family protein [Aspergillus heteromorphus CBS 117.55]|uniref:Aconitase family protein n=1 Tax=Aspergillus heteromorphus CBS 117.55 TaxID=1448321 RepID=A0A317W3C1_9EURO|nr:aconitase family protein [Aspergillus heteromorphus CBS 117.55]PWY79618.1 aconitase family protein [Aspergillus heteromorphus CBS 117.55]